MGIKYDELNGAWEERGVIGTRIEIYNKEISIFWQNIEVNSTTYVLQKEDEKLILKLKNNELKHKDGRVYAIVEEISYNNGKLSFIKNFPITGKNEEVLSKTENSRYGNYEICDDILKEIKGVWTDGSEYMQIEIKNNVLKINGTTQKIHVLKSKSAYDNEYKIVDIDPSVSSIGSFSKLLYKDGKIIAQIFVCDVGMESIELYKRK